MAHLPGRRPRKTRRFYNEPGQAHEFTFSCYRRLPLFAKDRPRQWLIDALAAIRVRYPIALLAYVIMPEHAHVLLFPLEPTYEMEEIAKSLKQSVARRALAFLRKHDQAWLDRHLRGERAGTRTRYHFWQPGGGYDRNLHSLETITHSVNYLHENPVRRELVKRAIDWPWSSARWYAGLPDTPLAMDQPPL